MLTPINDNALVGFLRSMPYVCRLRVVFASFGVLPVLLCGIALGPVSAAMGLFCRWVAATICQPNVAFCIGFITTAMIQGIGFHIFSNVRLRKWLTLNSLDGQLRICPSCYRQPIDNHVSNCKCGCMLRPFDGIDIGAVDGTGDVC